VTLELVRVVGFASLQGAPLVGLRKYGVPSGGAFDLVSLRLANALAGNGEDARCIELVNAAGDFKSHGDIAMAVVGPIEQVSIDGVPAPANASFLLRAGQTFSIPASRSGLTVYLSCAGGFHGFGPHETTERLQSGEKLKTTQVEHPPRPMRLSQHYFVLRAIRVVLTTQIAQSILTVSANSSRVGIRLQGLTGGTSERRRSEPVCVGLIQRVPSGELIIIGPDGPTIGGYEPIGWVIDADLPLLGQLRPGATLRLDSVTQDGARKLNLDAEIQLQKRVKEITLASSL
jgi:antagonist of KipI